MTSWKFHAYRVLFGPCGARKWSKTYLRDVRFWGKVEGWLRSLHAKFRRHRINKSTYCAAWCKKLHRIAQFRLEVVYRLFKRHSVDFYEILKYFYSHCAALCTLHIICTKHGHGDVTCHMAPICSPVLSWNPKTCPLEALHTYSLLLYIYTYCLSSYAAIAGNDVYM